MKKEEFVLDIYDYVSARGIRLDNCPWLTD
jgi:hypothetical protein